MVKELVEYIVKNLVSQPEAVGVFVIRSGNRRTLEIKVDEQDRGKVIGRQGQTIKSLRALVNALIPEGQSVEIDLVQ